MSVLDKRSDGFHNIVSVFLAADFGDTLLFSLPDTDSNLTEIDMKGFDLPVPLKENIIFKAVSLFREKTGFVKDLKITVEKRIPVGGGLGGGSSDAAAVLIALNEITGFPCSREELLKMGASLGSDVPFFIYQTPAAFVTGRGEIIEPIEAPDLSLVLVNPGFSSSTADAFRLLDQYRLDNGDKEAQKHERNNVRLKTAMDEYKKDCNLNSIEGVSSAYCFRFYNDFLPVFKEPQKSVYNKIISRLRSLGADYSGLSGSGSTCFGIFSGWEKAQKAADDISREDTQLKQCARSEFFTSHSTLVDKQIFVKAVKTCHF